MPVTLENRLRRMQVFNLDHEGFCASRECACSEITLAVVDEHPRTGERAPRHVTKRIPSSLTLLALERRAGLPTAVLGATDVQAALARGHLRVVEQTPDSGPARNAQLTPGKEP